MQSLPLLGSPTMNNLFQGDVWEMGNQNQEPKQGMIS